MQQYELRSPELDQPGVLFFVGFSHSSNSHERVSRRLSANAPNNRRFTLATTAHHEERYTPLLYGEAVTSFSPGFVLSLSQGVPWVNFRVRFVAVIVPPQCPRLGH